MKQLVTLLNAPNIPGVEATVVTTVPAFCERYVSDVYLYDPWWGTLPITVEAYDAATYAAYTAVAPPAFDRLMFNADRSAFKCGSGNWWGIVQAMVIPYGG